MNLAPDVCYQALASRDRRFDGQFVVGVTSTGIYCRPICRVRCPKPDNCRFFTHPAAAEQAGFRPCLRCRPELAPRLSMMDATDQLAQAAMVMIANGFLDHDSSAALAGRIGVSERHLRRLFRASFGVTMPEVARTRRLLLAKRLLSDTDLPVGEVALAAGFGSQRRLNALFQTFYRLSPSRLRRAGSTGAQAAPITLALAYQPPLDWTAMLDFLAARQIEGLERIEAGCWQRSILIEKAGSAGMVRHAGWISVTHTAPGQLALTLPVTLVPVMAEVLRTVRHLFDLDAPMPLIEAHLKALGPTGAGIRVPGAVTGFEMAVRAIVGQQITTQRARRVLAALVAQFGEPLAGSPGVYLFPSPAMLAAQPFDALIALGLLRIRAEAIIAVAWALLDNTLQLSPGAPVAANMKSLRDIRGIGDWTAQYIAMRALAWPDAFPAGDLVLKRALGCSSAGEAAKCAEGWSPWRAYGAIRLWQSASSGAIQKGKGDEAVPAPLNEEPT
ncbi:Ada metal-binding domain-containing protein [Kushneria indalinina]|uniref:DNA-3-methyladenine glycosylase II n=1 Tax=Kushneria indalinina DSM 14324 TaxID=1122140 RepID=A0A3D9DUC3_9GAMM|nr:Ada metal-binding domain-containing protein [Kushneria indalinina]REC94390.1 DNA-3-methyladenine glycosylase II [Kushneria indalinina DSM 14324]